MQADGTKVLLFPSHGVLTGTLSSYVFRTVKGLPGQSRWVRGELHFALTAPNLDYLRAKLAQAEWQTRDAAPLARLGRKPAPKTKVIEHEFRQPPIGRQREAFERACKLEHFALFMDMGTGKTFVALNLAAHFWRLGVIDLAFVAAFPSGVARQWLEEQLPLHAPTWLRWRACLMRTDGRPPRWVGSRDDDALELVITNVEKLSHESGKKAMLRTIKGRRAYGIVDESSRMGTPSARRTRALLTLGQRNEVVRRLIMSGKPVRKSLENLYTQYKFLDPGIIGLQTYTGFRRRYCVMGGWEMKQVEGYQHVDELLEKLEPYTLVAKKDRTWPIRSVERTHDLTTEQVRLYREMKNELAVLVRSAQGSIGEDRLVAAAHAAHALVKMQQITNGYLEDKAGDYFQVLSTARPQLVLDVLEEAGDQQVIIFCRFHRDLDMVGDALRRAKLAFFEYSGRTTARRDVELDKFKRGELQIMLATAAAGGVGLNLAMASVTIYYSNTSSSDDREQSKARTDREGQTGLVTFVDLIGSPVDRKIILGNEQGKTINDLVMSLDVEELAL